MSMLNLRRYTEINTDDFVLGFEGIYTLRAIKPGIGVVREIQVPNLITNTGMNSFGGAANIRYMQLGTGTATPAFTDTALANYGVSIASFTDASGFVAGPPAYGWARNTWTSSVGGATGNWTEIGVSNQAATGNLRSRALILDNMGSPTTFPVLADEQFQGSYELRLYPPSSDSAVTVNLSGVPYDATARALGITAAWAPFMYVEEPMFRFSSGEGFKQTWYTGALASRESSTPAGAQVGSSNASSVSAVAYGSGNFYQDIGARWGASVAVGSCRTASLQMLIAKLQVEYDPVINKLASQELIINHRTIWARR